MVGGNKKDPYSLREIFQQMELDLIASLKRNIFTHKDEELKEGFKWEQWQLSKLRNLIKYRNENKKIVGESSKDIQNTINEVLQESYQTGEENVEKAVNKISSQLKLPEGNVDLNNPQTKESNKPAGKPETVLEHHEENFFGMNEKKLTALQDSVNDDFKEAQQSILRQMDDVYRQTVYKTHVYLQSGAVSLSQAIDMATKDFLERGINCIEYSNGRRVNISSYAEMTLRTASQRATFLGEGTKRDEWGIHTIAVSAHANTCPLCLPWQGRVLIDDVYSYGSKADGDYPLLSEAMKAGLLHPQCRHTLATFFPGITKLPKPADEEEAAKNYLAEQKQRLMERQIRKYKRIAAGSVDTDNIENANAKVREWQAKLRQHLKDNPELRRDYSRERPGPGISNRDVDENVKKIYGDDYFKDGYRYSKDGIMRVTNDWKGKHRSIPKKYKPNAVIETNTEYKNGHKQTDRSIYDKNGMLYKQIHNGNHNMPKQHPYGKHGEHAHMYEWDEKGIRRSRITRELTKKERNEHRDILGGD